MRFVARMSLAIVVLLFAALVLPRPATRVVAGDAIAQPVPTPTLPDILPNPDPSPTPTETPGGGGGGGGGNGGGGNGENNGGGQNGGDGGKNEGDTPGDPDAPKPKKGKKGGGKPAPQVPNLDYNRIEGAYSTDRLVAAATRLRGFGWSEARVTRRVFVPFIIAGPANWIDTWGAPRYGPGPVVRTHEGQDVFCESGDPVIAGERGTIEFDNQRLGGKIARLHRSDGSYWYYAHLSDFSPDLSSGNRVAPGDVIGYCGNTGNALTTPPHVHFGWYSADGAGNPMRWLIRWLREAEANAEILVAKASGERVQRIDSLTAARRFGDAFVPDMSVLELPGESLLAAGSSPATGAFALAEAALQMALSNSEAMPAPAPGVPAPAPTGAALPVSPTRDYGAESAD